MFYLAYYLWKWSRDEQLEDRWSNRFTLVYVNGGNDGNAWQFAINSCWWRWQSGSKHKRPVFRRFGWVQRADGGVWVEWQRYGREWACNEGKYLNSTGNIGHIHQPTYHYLCRLTYVIYQPMAWPSNTFVTCTCSLSMWFPAPPLQVYASACRNTSLHVTNSVLIFYIALNPRHYSNHSKERACIMHSMWPVFVDIIRDLN